MSRALCAVLLAIAATATTAAAGDCRHSEPRDATLDAAGATAIEITSVGGWLEVVGSAHLDRVEVDARACADRERALERMQLLTDRRGDTLVVEARIDDGVGGWGASPRLEMKVRVPAGLAVTIDDGSGWIKVSGTASLKIEDGSGDITVRDVAGEVDVEDGSGDIDIRACGEVRIDDGSGDIEIGGVATLRVDDGSGDVEIRDVTGDVILTDGSGDLRVAGVGGDVLVEGDGSGGIRVSEVAGDLTVERDGSGGIHHEDVRGAVRLP